MRALLSTLGLLALACAPAERAETAGGSPGGSIAAGVFEAPLVLDVRDPEAFAAGHVPGAINLQWGWSQLSERLDAYAPDRAGLIAIDADDGRTRERALELLSARGFERVGSHLAPERRTTTLPLITAAELALELGGDAPPIVLDVRTPSEWESGTIDGALLFGQDEAPTLAAELDRERRYAVICEGGYRSSQLASWMVREGFADVVNVIDGMAGWWRLPDH